MTAWGVPSSASGVPDGVSSVPWSHRDAEADEVDAAMGPCQQAAASPADTAQQTQVLSHVSTSK